VVNSWEGGIEAIGFFALTMSVCSISFRLEVAMGWNSEGSPQHRGVQRTGEFLLTGISDRKNLMRSDEFGARRFSRQR